MPTIETEAQFDAVLRRQGRDQVLQTACRAALRALPVAFDDADQPVASHEGLSAFRAVLSATAAAVLPSRETEHAASASFMWARFAARLIADSATGADPAVGSAWAACYSVAEAAMYTSDEIAGFFLGGVSRAKEHSKRSLQEFESALDRCIDHSARAVVGANKKERAIALQAAYRDAEIGAEMTRVLWGSSMPAYVAQHVDRFLTRSPMGDPWVFWRMWYQGFLDGEPMDWALQREVALIPDADWGKGPEHVARLIVEIEARFALKARIRALEEELARASADRFGIGGNDPPEPIEDELAIPKEFVAVWEPLQALKSQTVADTPDPSLVAKAIGRLRACGSWIWDKTDRAATAASVAAGTASGTALVAWLAGYGDTLMKVIEAAERWLGFL